MLCGHSQLGGLGDPSGQATEMLGMGAQLISNPVASLVSESPSAPSASAPDVRFLPSRSSTEVPTRSQKYWVKTVRSCHGSKGCPCKPDYY